MVVRPRVSNVGTSRVFRADAVPFHDVAWGNTKELVGLSPAAGGEVCAEVEFKVTEFLPGYSHKGHVHSSQLEVLYVLSGHGMHEDQAGNQIPFGPGDVVYIPAGYPHANHNPGTEPVRVLVIKIPPSAA